MDLSEIIIFFVLPDARLQDSLLECAARVAVDSAVVGWCPLVWDSWSCHPATPPGNTSSQPCPHLPDLTFDTDRSAVVLLILYLNT